MTTRVAQTTTTTKFTPMTRPKATTTPKPGSFFRTEQDGKPLGWVPGNNMVSTVPEGGGYMGSFNLYKMPRGDLGGPEYGGYFPWYGDYTLYNKGGSGGSVLVLGCTDNAVKGKPPKITTSATSNYSVGSWKFHDDSHGLGGFIIECATKKGLSDYCINIANKGASPSMVPCNTFNFDQIFLEKQWCC